MNVETQKFDLNECDREAIHQIGEIQSFGGLIAVNGDWVIAHRSVNCGELLGMEGLPKVGEPLADHFSQRTIATLRDGLTRVSGDDSVERLFGVQLIPSGELFDCAVHRSGKLVIIEFEPHDEANYADHLAIVGPIISQLEPMRQMGLLCDKAARLTREMLGFDRVMIYKFHRDETGEVIAEDRREDLESYLGLRYPRTDIPQQARDLFRRNRVRVIGDMDAEPVAIEPARSLSGEPIDLSMSVLRSPSPIHYEYMRNMGVGASLAIAIVRHGRLWGLIACHHYEAKLLPFSLRTVAEMFSQMFSLMLDRILMEKSDGQRERGRHLHDQLMQRLAGGESLGQSLPMLDDVLREVIQHDGASMLVDGKYTSRGAAPNEQEFMDMAPALGSAPTGMIIASSQLAAQIPAAEAFGDRAAGAIVLPISRSPRDYLILWRKPLTQKVSWAGDPAKSELKEGERLQPRGSFAAWEETVEGRSEEWSDEELQVAESLRVTLLEVILRMTDETSRERARAKEQQDLLIAELNHRVRNILNLIRGLVSQSQDEAMSVSEFSKIIGGRISALAAAHDNITRENWAPAPLSKLFETELGAYLNEKTDRFQLGGEDVLVRPEAYTVLALVVHELVTNSAKYGSLCDRTGKLTVDFNSNRFGDLEISWRERGGPPVKPPRRRGFGSTIIERSIPYELKGDANLRFKLEGLEADFTIPQRFIMTKPNNTSGSDAPTDASQVSVDYDSLILPNHVLVVEDSMIIALDTEENLRRLGVKSVSVESNVEGALSSIDARKPDFAIVDFNLGDVSSEPVALKLKSLGVPFVLATGYAEMADQIEALGAKSLLAKPYGPAELEGLFGMGDHSAQ